TASGIVAHIDSVVVGLAAGLLAFWYLRRYAALRFPAYQLAGALTGILLVVAELLVATGGADLLHAAASISPADKTALDLLDSARIVNSLLVLFIGALAAMIALGRTLGSKHVPEPVAEPVAEVEPAPPAQPKS
ncbi:MAG TPA: hypothetical protein VKG45_15995, partial [Actinomycetes bacterium]|nr:hypothetical protein [Actinomycetes bacterium]